MPQVTVVVEDSLIGVDGLFLRIDYTFPADLWAIQWNGSSGVAELTNHTIQQLTIEDVQPYINAHTVAVQSAYDLNKRQQMEQDAVARARHVRDQLMVDVFDTVASKPFLWAEMSSVQQAAYLDYRAALKDLPASSDWNPVFTWNDSDPDQNNHYAELTGVVWPTKP